MKNTDLKIALEILVEQTKRALTRGLGKETVIQKSVAMYENTSDPDLSKENIALVFDDNPNVVLVGKTALKILRLQVTKRFPLPLNKKQVDNFSEPTKSFTSSEIKKFFLEMR